MRARLILASAAVWLLGCSGILVALDPPVGVTITEAAQLRSLDVGGTEATTDDRFVVLDVTVKNTSAHEDFAVAPTAFALATESGLQLSAHESSALVDGACDAGTVLTFEASVSCTVVFDVPTDDDPESLIFTTPEGRAGTAEVNLGSCEWCADACVDLDTDPENCGECGRALGDGQDCDGGLPECTDSAETLCDEVCADLDTDEDHCGACGDAVPPDHECEDGEATCEDGSLDSCPDGCFDLQSDPDHCGSCDEAVPPDHVCEDGIAECEKRGLDSCPDGCFDLDEDADHCGACDQSCPTGDECYRGEKCRDYEQSDGEKTCDQECRAIGYTCYAATAFYYSNCSGDYDDRATIECDELPPAQNGSCTYLYALGCYCEMLL